jgi:arabinoxylan arabinofuranohydrolase
MKNRSHTFSLSAAALLAAALLLPGARSAMGQATNAGPSLHARQGVGNPYLPLWEHVPDGEPRVFEDPDRPGKFRAYIIGSHDVRVGSYCGPDIRAWSAAVEDLTNWRDEGSIFTYKISNQWDVMYAPDLVEVKQKDGKKVYYLYPHSRGANREAMVAKGDRPTGPFTPVNLTPDGTRTLPGSTMGFDPAVWIEYITDQNSPDFGIGYRAFGYWGFQQSSAGELDPTTMYSLKPGTEAIPRFIPATGRGGGGGGRGGRGGRGAAADAPASQPAQSAPATQPVSYPYLFPGENPAAFSFFEAASIRKVGNKYVWIYSGSSGPEYGIGGATATLRYAYGDSPLGPWKSGGVLVDARAPVPTQDGARLQTTFSGHNTHGSIQLINDQWYAFYHRAPRGFGNARQATVAPVKVETDDKTVAQGGKVTIRGYDPYAKDNIWTAKAADGTEYTGAEVTSEGFQIFGLDPYQYYSAGYASYLNNQQVIQDTWDNWDNNMPLANMQNGNIAGYKYFGFGGLANATKGLKPFEGTKPGNNTAFNLFVTPRTASAFKVNVWLDGPWDNATWKGKKIGEISVPENAKQEVTQFTVNVSQFVDNLKEKHAIFLVVEGPAGHPLCDIAGLGFSSDQKKIVRPVPPTVTIQVNGQPVQLPPTPIRSTNANGIVGVDLYEASYPLAADATEAPKVTASVSDTSVKVTITQPESRGAPATVKFDNHGVVKTYRVVFPAR